MTLEELYRSIGGDYDSAMAYLRSPALIQRLVTRYLDDTSLPRLFASWAERDRQESFRAAHEAKGVCSNLFLTNLASLSSQVTEALRPTNEPTTPDDEVSALIVPLQEAYEQAIAAIRAYAAK